MKTLITWRISSPMSLAMYSNGHSSYFHSASTPRALAQRVAILWNLSRANSAFSVIEIFRVPCRVTVVANSISPLGLKWSHTKEIMIIWDCQFVWPKKFHKTICSFLVLIFRNSTRSMSAPHTKLNRMQKLSSPKPKQMHRVENYAGHRERYLISMYKPR